MADKDLKSHLLFEWHLNINDFTSYKRFFGKTFPKSRISVKIMLPFDINVCKEIRWITVKKIVKNAILGIQVLNEHSFRWT